MKNNCRQNFWEMRDTKLCSCYRISQVFELV